MGPQRGASSSILASFASWVLLASWRIEFCLSHAPPATTVSRLQPQALPWSALHYGTPTPVSLSSGLDSSVPPLVSSQPTVPQLISPQPTTSQSTNPQPMILQSTNPQPTTSQSTSQQPTNSQPTSSQPTVSQSTSPQPTVSQSTSSQPTVLQSTSSQPTVPHSTSSHPTVSQSTSPQPTVSQSTSSQPTVSQSTSSHPTVSQSTSPQPTVSQSTSSQPTTSHSPRPQPTSSQSTSPQPTISHSTSPQPTTSHSTRLQPTSSQSTSSQPTTSQSTSPQPTSSQSTSSQPTTFHSPSPQPTPSQSTSPQPTTSQSTSSQPTTFHSPSPQSMSSQSTSPQPTSSQSTNPQPTTSHSTSPQPTSSQSTSPQPTTSHSTSPQLTTSHSTSPQPTTSHSTSPQPTSSQSTSPQPTSSHSTSPQPTSSQSTSPQPTSSQSTSPQLTTSHSTSPQPTTSHSTSPQLASSHSPSPQHTSSKSISPHPTTSQSTSPQPLISQSISPRSPAPQSLNTQSRPPFPPLTSTHPPASSHLLHASMPLYLHPQPNLFFTRSPKSGFVIGGGGGEREDEERDAGTGNGDESGGGGGGGGGRRGMDWQDTTGFQVINDSDSNTSHLLVQPSLSTEPQVGSEAPHSAGRVRTGEEEEHSEAGAPPTEKSSRKLHSSSRKGDKLSRSGAFVRGHPLNPAATSWPQTRARKDHGDRWHQEAVSRSSNSSSSSSLEIKGGLIADKERYRPPLLARGALDLTSGEQDQPMKRPPPAEALDRGSSLYGGAGRPAGLLNVNEMMVNSLRSLEQEYTSEETRLFEEKSVSREGEDEEEEEEEEEELLEEDNMHQPISKLEVVVSPCVNHKHLSHVHEHEAEKERHLMRETVARGQSQHGANGERLGPSSHLSRRLHHPSPPITPSQPLPTLITLHLQRVATTFSERVSSSPHLPLVTLESHLRPAPSRPRHPSPPPSLLRTSPHNKGDVVKRRKNLLDQKTPLLASALQVWNKSVVLAENSSPLALPVSHKNLEESVHSVITKPVISDGSSNAGPDEPRRLRESTPQRSVHLHEIRAGGSEQWSGRSPTAPPFIGSSHKWSVEKVNESESSARLHLFLSPAGEKTLPTPGKGRYAFSSPPTAPSFERGTVETRQTGGKSSAGLAPSWQDITRGGKKREENITPVERREKNMVETTVVRKNGGRNLRPVTPRIRGERGGRGREERGGEKENSKEIPQDSDPLLSERNDDDERTSYEVNFAGVADLSRRSQVRRRKRLFKRNTETTAQVSEGGRRAGGPESPGQRRQKMRSPLAPRAAFQEAPHAAADVQHGATNSRAAFSLPHEVKTGIVDEVNKGGSGGPHMRMSSEAPRGLAPVPGPADPPSRHHVPPGPMGSGGADYSYLPPGFETVDTSEGCQCWQTHDDSFTPEEECRCQGEHIVQLPHNLSTSMDRLSLNKMGLESLGHRNLSAYSASIKELILQDVNKLSTLESDVFRNMPQLRTIYISHAPRLVKLPLDVFHVFLPSLKVLRIVHTGLTVLPGISQLLLNRGILHLLDLENNKIKRITTASVSIRAIQLLLNNNSLQTVEAAAFKGSEIDKLSMNGNTELTNLHPLAFQGIKSLTTLDLSNTAISRLPTEGLGGLETLILTGTHDLKVFPSVYSFKHITTAHLTYPYHCCAFRYPRLHDPAEHRKHEEFLRQMEKDFCVDITSPSPKTSLMGVGWRKRQRASPASSPDSSRPFSLPEETEIKRGGRQVLSDPSQHLIKSHHFPPPEVQIVGVETIARPVTSSPPPSTSLRSLLPPLTALKSTQRTSRLNLSPSSHVNEGKNIEEGKTQVMIMGVQGEQKDEVKEVERKRREGRLPPPVNNNPSHLKSSTLASQVKGVKDLPRRLPRSSLGQHNDSLPQPPMAPPAGAGGGWGVSLSETASAARLDEPHYVPSGDLDAPGTPIHLGVDPDDSLDQTYHPYHPGGFADGGAGAFDDHGVHDFDPAGGFGKVVEEQGKPREALDIDQFFHVNEVTVSPVKTVCGGNLSKNYRDVRCYPEPDAFNPCEDIMGNLGLRVAVWVVVVTAVFGNLSVMIVLMSTRFKMTVSKFLMCNLAVADLCMGLYLLLIAAMDLHTIGVYFNSAIYWQNGPGCKVAGFLTVFASELSILTLTVITLERWYAITYAIHLNKRLRLSVAARVMVLAWLYALIMAALPLVGVSGYSKTSICLPMETADTADQAYLLILLITNGLAFVLICVCYAKMYCSIAGNNLAANTSDTTVAKRMALLVFTDFACWAPIAFFGLTAVCGYPLISVTHAKFLLVFFYPLNSCANPYLYAILTKQYRRDLFLMLARHGFFTRRAMKYKGGCSTNTWLNHHHVCVSGGPGGGGSGGPSRRISTLTQITTCGEWRGRARDGSEESLPRQASPPRVRSISAELAVPISVPPGGGVDRRLSDVCRKLQPVAEVHDGRASPQPATTTSGSPHPIKNCYARMSFTPEQEALLQRYASDRQSGATTANAHRRPSATDSRDDPMPLTLYTPTTPDTITTPISPSLDHAV